VNDFGKMNEVYGNYFKVLRQHAPLSVSPGYRAI
jgi:hypothetical protein